MSISRALLCTVALCAACEARPDSRSERGGAREIREQPVTEADSLDRSGEFTAARQIWTAQLASAWVVNIGRAIPTFAVAGLLVPISLRAGWGFEPWPIFIALLLLALVPIYLTTYTAIRQVPDGPVYAARALGYTEPAILA